MASFVPSAFGALNNDMDGLLADDFLAQLASDLSGCEQRGVDAATPSERMSLQGCSGVTQPISIGHAYSVPTLCQSTVLPCAGALSAPAAQAALWAASGSGSESFLGTQTLPQPDSSAAMLIQSSPSGMMPPLGFLAGPLPPLAPLPMGLPILSLDTPTATLSGKRGIEDDKDTATRRSKGAAAQARFRHRQKVCGVLPHTVLTRVGAPLYQA